MSFPLLSLAYALGEFSPLISRWLGGEESEKVAQKVVDVAATLTGERDPLKLLRKFKENPKTLAEFQKALLKMEHDLELSTYKDRENARLRDVALAQAGRSHLRADIMVISAAFGLISCLITITLYRMSLPGEAVGVISTIAGIFGACLKDAYAFEFGSSRGSKMKDNNLSAFYLAKKN